MVMTLEEFAWKYFTSEEPEPTPIGSRLDMYTISQLDIAELSETLREGRHEAAN